MLFKPAESVTNVIQNKPTKMLNMPFSLTQGNKDNKLPKMGTQYGVETDRTRC